MDRWEELRKGQRTDTTARELENAPDDVEVACLQCLHKSGLDEDPTNSINWIKVILIKTAHNEWIIVDAFNNDMTVAIQWETRAYTNVHDHVIYNLDRIDTKLYGLRNYWGIWIKLPVSDDFVGKTPIDNEGGEEEGQVGAENHSTLGTPEENPEEEENLKLVTYEEKLRAAIACAMGIDREQQNILPQRQPSYDPHNDMAPILDQISRRIGIRKRECTFKDCTNKAVSKGRCCSHGGKRECIVENCSNYVVSGGRCCRHGGKRKRQECSAANCTNQAQIGGLCHAHGGKRQRTRQECSAENCTNQVVSGGYCERHGKKRSRKECTVTDCANQAQTGGLCSKHGGRRICSAENCTNIVVRKGVCKRHGDGSKRKRAPPKVCSYEGCTNQAQTGGRCRRHGAKSYARKVCDFEGCTNQAISGGRCQRHGAKRAPPKVCSYEGCTNQVQNNGLCQRHGAKKRTPKVCSFKGCTNQVKRGGRCLRHVQT